MDYSELGPCSALAAVHSAMCLTAKLIVAATAEVMKLQLGCYSAYSCLAVRCSPFLLSWL